MKNKHGFSAVIMSMSLSCACERSEAERQEQIEEERAEQREELREDTQEARYDSPAPTAVAPAVAAGSDVKTGLGAAAAEKIAEARCAREQKCGNVGPDEDYATHELCRQEISKEWAEEINGYECPNGLIEKELNECLEAIKAEDCASPFDTLGRVVACGSSDICKSPE